MLLGTKSTNKAHYIIMLHNNMEYFRPLYTSIGQIVSTISQYQYKSTLHCVHCSAIIICCPARVTLYRLNVLFVIFQILRVKQRRRKTSKMPCQILYLSLPFVSPSASVSLKKYPRQFEEN